MKARTTSTAKKRGSQYVFRDRENVKSSNMLPVYLKKSARKGLHVVGGFSLILFSLSIPLLAGLKTGADFLKIPIGAEAASLGQAYSAIPHGVHSLNWNPAGIAHNISPFNTPAFAIGFSHQEHFIDTTLDQLGLVFPAQRNRWSWGLNVVRLSYADQERRTADRQRSETFSAYDMSLGGAVARNFGSLQVGSQVKFIRMELAGYESQGAALDLGVLSRTPHTRLSVGATVRNIGPKMKFISEEFDLPLILSFGTAYRLSGPLLVSCELQSRPYQDQIELSFGTEYMASQTVSLRAGYLARLAETIENNQRGESNRGNFGGVNGLAAGFGVRFQKFSVDYSITPFGELGNIHSFSISSWFGENSENAEKAQPNSTQDDRNILILPSNEDPWWDEMKE